MEKSKTKYSVDGSNRLLIDGKAVNGSFSTDKQNRLIYRLNEPTSWRRKYGFPGKIIFTGKWSLNENHDLELEIEKACFSSRHCGEPAPEAGRRSSLSLKGEIISAESDKLVFEISQGQSPSGTVPGANIRLLKLSGSWGSDEANRIFFSVSKKTLPDRLAFQGGWRLNDNQQIVYSCEKTDLKRKTKFLSELEFSGYWEIASANRLAYILSRGTNSMFDFRVQLETPNIYPKAGEIKYRLGAGIRRPGGSSPDIISLYGTWRLSRDFGLNFDMQYADGRVHSLAFGAEVNFSKNNQIVFNLDNESGGPLGISVIFTHKLLRQSDAELFLRLKHSRKESGIDTGIKIAF